MPEKLSYSKFNALIEKYGYLITSIYFIDDDSHKKAIFLECRLPKTQKNVLIHIPSKFKMNLTKDIKPKLIEIVKADRNEDTPNLYGHLTDKSINYILNLRGHLINSDIAIISVDGICHSKFNGSIVCYQLKNNIPCDSDDESGNSSQEEAHREAEELKKIEQDLLKAANKLKINKSDLPEKTKIEEPKKIDPQPVLTVPLPTPLPGAIVQPIEPPVDSPVPLSENGLPPIQGPAIQGDVIPEPEIEDIQPAPVELVFHPAEDHPEEIVEPKVDDKLTKEIELESGEELSSESSDESIELSKKSKKLKLSQRSNYVDVEELDVQSGIVYVIVDVDFLFKKLEDYETYAIEVYEQLDDNEKDIRSDRIAEIKKQLDLAAKHLDLRIKKLEVSENGMKYHLLKLTGLLQDAENIKNKAKETKKSVPSGDIDKVYSKTKKTIHELNVSILRQKDELDDILLNYEESLKELFDL
jgi:hypothetical protein